MLPPSLAHEADERRPERQKLEELFVKYLKPVWWGRFVEGLNDFFGMIFHELIQPVWSLFAVPFAAGAAALVRATDPSLRAADVMDRLEKAAASLDAQNPGLDGRLGKGLLDIGAAVNGRSGGGGRH